MTDDGQRTTVDEVREAAREAGGRDVGREQLSAFAAGVGQLRGSGAPVSLEGLNLDVVDWVDAGAAAAAVGLRVHFGEGVVAVASLGDAALSVRASGGLRTHQRSERLVLLAPAGVGAAAVIAPDGAGVLVDAGSDTVAWLAGGRGAPPPPLEAWRALGVDAALYAWAREAIDVASDWSRAVGAGRVLRLARASAARPADIVRAVVEDAPFALAHAVDLWSRCHTPAQLRGLDDRVATRASLLLDELDALATEWAPDDEAWRALVAGLLRDRDDIESAWQVRAASGRSAAFEREVALVDERLEPFVAALPVRPFAPDALLARAADEDDMAYWAAPACFGEDEVLG